MHWRVRQPYIQIDLLFPVHLLQFLSLEIIIIVYPSSFIFKIISGFLCGFLTVTQPHSLPVQQRRPVRCVDTIAKSSRQSPGISQEKYNPRAMDGQHFLLGDRGIHSCNWTTHQPCCLVSRCCRRLGCFFLFPSC